MNRARGRRNARPRGAWLTVLAICAPLGVGAQPGAPSRAPERPRAVAGQIVRPGPTRDDPVVGNWAVLHRVGSDRAGPLDSMRTDAQGRYHFRYAPVGATDAIYFVSSSYGGIAYFTPPLRGDSVGGDQAVITVFDTTSRTLPLGVRGRHLVVSGSAVDGARSIVEVYELSNDTSIAIVAGTRDHATWSAMLPPHARDVRVGQGDVPPEAASIADGRVLVYAPFPPGVKQISFSYTLPADDFPLSIPAVVSTSIFEILLEDPRGSVEGGGMRAMPAAALEGRQMQRWLAQDVPANGVIVISLPRTIAPARVGYIIAITLALIAMMLASVAFARRRRPRVRPLARPLAPPPPDEVTRLACEIAALDDAYARGDPGVSPDDYAALREDLRTRLAEALATRGSHD